MTRTKVLIALLALLLTWNVGDWLLSNWGKITLDARDLPLAKVVRSFERQGRIQLLTNLDLSTPVTLQLKKATVPEALDRLAVVTSGQWSWVGAIAPDKAALAQLLNDAQLTEPPETLHWVRQPLPPMLGMMVSAPPANPQTQVWTAQFMESPEGPSTSLENLLRAASQTTDAHFLIPADWNPALASLPSGGPVQKLPATTAQSVGGTAGSFYYLRASRWGGRDDGPPPQGGQPPEGNNPPRGGGGPMGPPGPWMDYRMEQRLSTLPPAERTEAREGWNQQKTFFAEVSALPPEQRRARFEEMMQDPAIQIKIEEQQAKRDEQRTPEQRRGRYGNYVGRKPQAKGGN